MLTHTTNESFEETAQQQTNNDNEALQRIMAVMGQEMGNQINGKSQLQANAPNDILSQKSYNSRNVGLVEPETNINVVFHTHENPSTTPKKANDMILD